MTLTEYNIQNTIYRILFPILVFLLPLGLYVKTLAPTYIPVDSAEFALCMHNAGICHPPGFPLYILIGKVFTDLLPVGTLIYKANLLSAIFGAGTILFVFLALKELEVKRDIAFLLAIFLAVNSVFWEFATSADVFTFATFLIALTFLFSFRRRSILAFFALGLSASHFYISAVLLPLLIWYFIKDPKRSGLASLRGRSGFMVYCLLFFGLGFFPQALMYWRMQADPEINWGHAQGLSGFIDFVRRKEFGSIFLIANPVLTFSISKLFKHIAYYFSDLFLSFGFILPTLGFVGIFLGKILKDKKVILLSVSFFLLLTVQLVLLSTIDPKSDAGSFQISKFYLPSYTVAILLFGYSLKKITNKFFEENEIYVSLILGLLVVIYLFANFKVNDLSKNYFSQNLNLDALEQLPEGNVGITLSHIFYFGSVYEQKINRRFENASLLYFPNEKNKDMEFYNPQLFENQENEQFINEVGRGRELGKAERYILSVISRNLDKDIFILQGVFEEKFFAYLKPYLRPHGLWWRVDRDIYKDAESGQILNLLENFRNRGLTVDDFEKKMQKDDFLAYAVSYHSAAVELAKMAEYDKALKILDEAYQMNTKAENINQEIELVKGTKTLHEEFLQLVEKAEADKLNELGANLYTLGNYKSCSQVFAEVVRLKENDAAVYNNLASCFALSARFADAKVNYQKALELDPSLEKAKVGLEAIEK